MDIAALDTAPLLAQISRALVSHADVPHALRDVCGLAARLCGADRASIYLVDPEAAESIPAMSQFADGRRLDDVWPAYGSGRRRAVEELRFIHHLVTTRRLLVIDDARLTDMIEPIWVERFALKSVLGVPLVLDGRVLGILVLDTVDDVRPFDARAQLLAQGVADQLALYMHKQVLVERLEMGERLRETEGLLTLAGELGGSLDRVELARRAAREVTKLLDSDTTIVLRFDMETGAATAMAGYHVPEGLRTSGESQYAIATTQVDEVVLEAFRTGTPFACADATADHRFDFPFLSFLPCRPRGLVVIPLLARRLPYGAIVSYWWERRHTLNEGGLRVAAGVANHVSLALQNAELYGASTRALGDLKTAQEQLVRGETLRALGELAQGTAHHLNNLLTVIVARVQLMLDDSHDDTHRQLEMIERAALDATDVVRRVREFAHARPGASDDAIDMRGVVMDAIEMTRPRWQDAAHAAGVQIEIVSNLAPLPMVAGDAVALREAMTNLILNAVDALPAGGTIAVTTQPTGDGALVTVRDTGVGMSEEVRRRALEPFFTTKDVKRTGLGLSAAYGIVTRHRGTLAIASAESEGTTVSIVLPAVAVPAPASAPAPARHGETLRVLLVDDEERVRDSLAMVLRRQGHVVACAPSGRVALDHLDTGLTVDLVLTDLGMPDITGWSIARAVKQRWPDLPVGLITGWGDDPDGSPEERAAVDFILSKPIDRRALADAIARVTAPERLAA